MRKSIFTSSPLASTILIVAVWTIVSPSLQVHWSPEKKCRSALFSPDCGTPPNSVDLEPCDLLLAANISHDLFGTDADFDIVTGRSRLAQRGKGGLANHLQLPARRLPPGIGVIPELLDEAGNSARFGLPGRIASEHAGLGRKQRADHDASEHVRSHR
jgi:hypothetical protein